MDLKLGHHDENGIEVVEVEGEIDVYTAPDLRELLIALVNEQHYRLVINLDKVEFIDSTGLGVLVGGLKRVRAHDGWVELVCAEERVIKIFEITGLAKVFGVHASVNEAINARNKQTAELTTCSCISMCCFSFAAASRCSSWEALQEVWLGGGRSGISLPVPVSPLTACTFCCSSTAAFTMFMSTCLSCQSC